MARIREATPEDIERIIDMAYRFNDKYMDIPLSPWKLEDTVIHCCFNEAAVMLVSDTGFIAGLVSEDLVRDWTYLIEIAWYAEDRSGIALLNEFERRAKQFAVDEIRMSVLNTSDPSVTKLLQRKGYTKSEIGHSKRL